MRICKNDITDDLRRLFGANPLKTPDDSYQPFLLLEIVKNGRPKIIGNLEDLVKGDFNHSLEVKTNQLAEISQKRTKKVQMDFGLDLLKNFFDGFGIPPLGLEVAFNDAKQIGFSFQNVQRKHFSPLALGKLLSEKDIVADPNNFMLQKIMEDTNHRLALVTDVIVSNKFSMATYTDSDVGAGIKIPTIQGIIEAANAKVKVEQQSANEVSIERETPLTFAFSCIELKIHPETGAFSRGDWLDNIKSRGIKNVEQMSTEALDLQSKFLLDDNEFNPLLIE